MSQSHEHYMRRCFELAKKSGKNTRSNPNVGALIVYKDRIIGEGFHKGFGSAHAEIEALQNVKESEKRLLTESTMYVSLEPCRTIGKTGACTTAILKSGIKKLVVSVPDPNPDMMGSSLKLLRENGVDMTLGVCENEGQKLIAPFTANLTGRPYIRLKFAQTSDNYIGSKKGRINISNKASHIKSHQLRSQSDAILIGYNTALIDNPSLTTRLVPGDNPLRIVLDRELSLPRTHYLWNDGYPTLFITESNQVLTDSVKSLRKLKFDESLIPRLSQLLYSDYGICRLLVEGGAKTVNAFLESNSWDEIWQFKANKQLNKGVRAPYIERKYAYMERFLDDSLYVYYNEGHNNE